MKKEMFSKSYDLPSTSFPEEHTAIQSAFFYNSKENPMADSFRDDIYRSNLTKLITALVAGSSSIHFLEPVETPSSVADFAKQTVDLAEAVLAEIQTRHAP